MVPHNISLSTYKYYLYILFLNVKNYVYSIVYLKTKKYDLPFRRLIGEIRKKNIKIVSLI